MKFAAADLHCHTSASDGAFLPAQVVQLAQDAGIACLAITDHDTLAAHAAAIAAGSARGIRIIPGIEVSALAKGGEVHVLGYGPRAPAAGERIDPARSEALAQIDALRGRRDARARKMLARLEAHGIHIDFESVRRTAGDAMVGRPHLARAMLDAGVVTSVQQAFAEWIGEGRPAFAPHEGLDPAGAIRLIHAAGGVAVLAHPALYAGDVDGLLNEAIAAGIDGIEVFHPSATDDTVERLSRRATQHRLLTTGGSDFHGADLRYTRPIGTCRPTAEMLERLDRRMAERAQAMSGL